MPLQVVQGTEDEVVLPSLATRLVQSWTSMHDLVDDGQIDGSIDLTETVEEVAAVDGKHGYRHTTYTDAAGGILIDYYLVSGQGHAWSAAKGEGRYADNDGPEGAQLLWDFAREHPMP
ncbi:hypothetical protein [Promicromonospora sukumoe]|uniref:hypothetical protein n=1 Tax=Promicromonospora sukumoe TaxID=88382 RepID=UPI0036561A95